MSHFNVSPTCFEHAGRTDVGKTDDAASAPVPCSRNHRTVWSLDRMKSLSEAIIQTHTDPINYAWQRKQRKHIGYLLCGWTGQSGSSQ